VPSTAPSGGGRGNALGVPAPALTRAEPLHLTCGTDTGYTMQAEPGRYTLVLMPGTGQLMLSTGGIGDDGGCGRYVTLSP
jgi:hypothetical protein